MESSESVTKVYNVQGGGRVGTLFSQCTDAMAGQESGQPQGDLSGQQLLQRLLTVLWGHKIHLSYGFA